MDDTKQEQVWRTYPDYPFIQASNLGRIRTVNRIITDRNGRKIHIKGRVLKQQLHKDGYLQVQVKVNGKPIDLLVHRLVAVCFIPNPLGLPEVNHIDNDRTNNSVSNLEWCDRQYNEAYKKNFGTSPAQIFGKPVFAVNLDTGKVLRFETQVEASRQLGINPQNISSVIRGKLYQTSGWWFTEDESEITEDKIREIKDKTLFRGGVIAINLDTGDVSWFESQMEAKRQLGIHQTYISAVVKGKCNKAKGCWFCYADGNAVEKTRAKFGDKVAKKVEKLMAGIEQKV